MAVSGARPVPKVGASARPEVVCVGGGGEGRQGALGGRKGAHVLLAGPTALDTPGAWDLQTVK